MTEVTDDQVRCRFKRRTRRCRRTMREVSMTDDIGAVGDALFLSPAEETIEFSSREPQRADKLKALGFEAMWLALAEGD